MATPGKSQLTPPGWGRINWVPSGIVACLSSHHGTGQAHGSPRSGEVAGEADLAKAKVLRRTPKDPGNFAWPRFAGKP